MAGLRRCKLSQEVQKRLMEYFVLEVTARSAADLLGIQPNTAALFYRKLRQVIVAHLEQEAQERFDGAVELDESYFGGVRKGKRGRAAAGKVVVFGLLKRGGKVYAQTVRNTKSKTLMKVVRKKVAPDRALFTPTATAAITRWMWRHFTTSVSTTANTLHKAKTTSTALRTSGIRPSGCCVNIMVSPSSRSRCFSKSASFVSTMVARSNSSTL
jgi:transposase-like protein